MGSKVFRVVAMAFAWTISAQAWPASPLTDWGSLKTGDTTTYADDQGSRASFNVVEGPQAGVKAIQMDFHQTAGGYCGIAHDGVGDLSKALTLTFQAKADPPGSFFLTIVDAKKTQYVAKVTVSSKDWAEVAVPLVSFEPNKYYQPEGADTSNPLDPAKAPGIGFAPAAPGDARFFLGPIAQVVDDPVARAKALEAKRKAAPKGDSLLQDFAVPDDGLGGTWKDDKGSTLEMTFRATPKKDKADDRTCYLKYNLVDGGWCGIWYRAGTTWDGVDFTTAKALVAKVFSEKPLIFGVSLEDVNKHKVDTVLTTPTTGGRWENVVLPLENLPEDFSVVKTFNVYMKTPGENLLAIDTLTVKR